jgi:ADP-ribose pyrophosphatase YjhB (NUDIX family)
MGEFKKTSHAIIIFEGRVLLELRDKNPNISDPNKWSFPGGEMWMGEDFAETLQRELKEEISVAPQDVTHLGLIINSQTRSRHETYLCRLTPEEAGKVKLGNEGQELKFFTYDEMLKLPHAKYAEIFITQYGKGLKKLIETGEIDMDLLGFDGEGILYL